MANPSQLSFRRIALLVDADNVSASWLPTILAELAKHGTPGIRRAYGDWTSPQLAGWKQVLHEHALRPVQQFSYSKGKNATDMALVIDAMELLYTQQLDAFGIVSSDADFTPLVMHLRDAGCTVFGFGERKTPEPFVKACSEFLFLDQASVALPGDAPATAPVEPVAKLESSTILAQDTKLVMALRAAVAASARDDGWAMLATAGSNAKRASAIDPRNYGVKNFTALFERTGLFDIVRVEGGHPLISDKRNLDRAKTPQP